MTDATKPQTDRELLLKLNGEIENLSKAIYQLSAGLKDLEENKMTNIENRLIDLENVWHEVKGGWKFAVVLWLVISAILGWIIAWALKSFV